MIIFPCRNHQRFRTTLQAPRNLLSLAEYGAISRSPRTGLLLHIIILYYILCYIIIILYYIILYITALWGQNTLHFLLYMHDVNVYKFSTVPSYVLMCWQNRHAKNYTAHNSPKTKSYKKYEDYKA